MTGCQTASHPNAPIHWLSGLPTGFSASKGAFLSSDLLLQKLAFSWVLMSENAGKSANPLWLAVLVHKYAPVSF